MGSLTFSALGWALVIDVGVAIIVFTLFNFLRALSVTGPFYAAKRHLNIPFRYRPPELTKNPLTWWLKVLWFNQADVLACAGQDALTYIRILSLGLRMCFYVGIVVLGIVLPVNLVAGSAISCSSPSSCSTANTKNLANLDYTSLANIPNKSNLMWVHLGAVYLITIIVLRMLWAENKQAVALRVKYLASTPSSAVSHTILVRNIPGVHYGTVTHRVVDYADSPITCCIPKSIKAKAATRLESGVDLAKGNVDKLGQFARNVPGGKVLKNTGVPPEQLDVYTSPDAVSNGGGSANNQMQHRAYDPAMAPGGIVADAALPLPPRNQHAPAHYGNIADGEHRPSVPIMQKYLSLANRDHYDQPCTDFDTWHQAEAAIQGGMSVEELVRREFGRTYAPDEIESVTVVKDTEHLRGPAAQYAKTRTQLEDLIERWNAQLITGKAVKPQTSLVVPLKEGRDAVEKWGNVPTRVDKAEYLEWKLNHLRNEVQTAQEDASHRDTSTAFVTFRSRLNQVQAANTLHYHNQAFWSTETAMAPMEVVWSNVALRGWEQTLRFILAWTIFLLIVAFYTIPVTALQGLLQINHWKSVPGMSTILSNPVLNGLVAGIIPGLALKIFLAILPSLIRWINKLQGIHSSALIDFEVGRKYYMFLYLQVFVIFIIGGSLITNAKSLANNPGSFVKSLGQIIPSTASFYLTYTLIQGLISIPISILKIVGVIIFVLRSGTIASDRAKRRLWAYQYYFYGRKCPSHTLTILFLLTFGVMTPLIAGACFIYFVTALLVARYQLLYVFRENYQTGGRFWPIVFDQIMTALFTFQIVMLAVLSVKQFPWSPFILIPIAATALYLILSRRRFDRPLGSLSAHAAADLDRADATHPVVSPEDEVAMREYMDCENTPVGRPNEVYVNPAFKVAEDHDDVIRELHSARHRVVDRRAGAAEDVGAGAGVGLGKRGGTDAFDGQNMFQGTGEAAGVADAV